MDFHTQKEIYLDVTKVTKKGKRDYLPDNVTKALAEKYDATPYIIKTAASNYKAFYQSATPAQRKFYQTTLDITGDVSLYLALCRAGITTLGALKKKTAADLKTTEGIGRARIKLLAANDLLKT